MIVSHIIPWSSFTSISCEYILHSSRTLESTSWTLYNLESREVSPHLWLFSTPQTWKVFSAQNNVSDGNIKPKEYFKEQNPEDVVDIEPCHNTNLVSVVLEDNDQGIVKDDEENNNKKVAGCLLSCDDIFHFVAPKLRKCSSR